MRSQSFSSKSRNSISAFLTITILAMLAALLFAPLAQAQTTGTLTGTAYDQTGAVVPKSKVILLNQTSGDIRQTTCNEVGYSPLWVCPRGLYRDRGGGGLQVLEARRNRDQPWRPANHFQRQAGDWKIHRVDYGGSDAGRSEAGRLRRACVGAETKDIDKLVLATRDVTVLMKILPGVSTDPGLGAGSGVDWRNIIGARAAWWATDWKPTAHPAEAARHHQ